MTNVYIYWGRDGSNDSRSDSSDDDQRPIPTTVVFDHLGRKQSPSSEGADDPIYYIDASPLSDQFPVDRAKRLYGKTTAKAKNGRSASHRDTFAIRRNVGQEMAPCRRVGTSDAHHSKVAALAHDRRREHGRRKSSTGRSETLSWRMDPASSLSDFALTVVGIDDRIAIEKSSAEKKRQSKRRSKRRDKWIVEGLYLDLSHSDDDANNTADDDRDDNRDDPAVRLTNAVTEEYHLHKVNLAVGQRRCDYFARLFQKGGVSTGSHSIEVGLSCLPAIPVMLDYLYHCDPEITTATAVPLRYLGTLLGNRSLFDAATRFLQKDLRPETAAEYLPRADLYHEKKLAEVCVRMCAEEFGQLKITWLASLPPRLMKRVLHSRHFVSSNSQVVCSKIASYCRCQLHKIDRGTLLSLTGANIMPVVSPEEALFFIQLMTRLGMDMEGGGQDHYISAKERSLYERCIEAAPAVVSRVIGSLAAGAGDASDVEKARSMRRKASASFGDYSRLPPQVKVDLLEFVVAKQQKS